MPQQTKIFRVFVSSTFNDMKTERKLLQEKVFPELEKFCRQNGARFQAIDLRWGVSEESQRDQKTMEICLNEIKRCQQITPKPNFLILLGDRYGWQPVPAKIPQIEMDMLFPLLSPDVKDLVNNWYKLDTNAIPAEYVLQPRKGAFSDYAHWKSIETDLRDGFRTAALEASFDNDALIKYTTSATHQEIIAGALNPSYGAAVPKEHVFVLSRQINNLPEDKSAADFIDLNENGLRDEYCKTQLEDLRKVLEKKLGDNFISYSVNWNGGKKLFSEQDEFDENIFVESNIKRLKGIIEDHLKTLVDEDELQMEIRYHQEFAASMTAHFTGRQSTFDEIQDYLNDSQNNKVLALIGASGSGKTCVMARALELAKSDNTILVARFIGANAKSSNLLSLLSSMCSQIAQAFGKTLQDMVKDLQQDRLLDYDSLAMIFPKCLALATPDKPLVLYLDALDQLSESDDANSLNWLPRILPTHVHLVVSALPEIEGRFQEAQVIHLPLMPHIEGEVLLSAWLASSSRQLTVVQKKFVMDKFQQCGLPIYLKMAFEQVRDWHSYDPMEKFADNVPEMIIQFIHMLEQYHYSLLVAKVVGYILSGKDKGLTEDEILDLLVFDEEHWQYFMQHICHHKHLHEVSEAKRLPIVLWSRLFLDLEPYLTERDSYGERIISFYHRQFNEVLAHKYFNDAKCFHGKLGEYFSNRPNFFDSSAQKKPNVRKCVEQPFQLVKGEMWDDISETLCNLDFIQAKCVAGMFYDLIQDYHLTLDSLPERQFENQKEAEHDLRIQKYVDALIARAGGEKKEAAQISAIKRRVDNRFQVSLNNQNNNFSRVDRLKDFLYFLGQESSNLQQYAKLIPNFSIQHAWNFADSGPVGDAAARIVQTRLSNRAGDLLLCKAHTRPQWKPMPTILKRLTGHTEAINAIKITPDGKIAFSGSSDKSCVLWDLVNGKILKILVGHKREVRAVSITPDGRFAISGSFDKNCILWDLASGKAINTFTGDPGGDLVNVVALGGRRGCESQVLSVLSGEALRNYQGHKEAIWSISISADGKRFLSGAWDGTCILWDIVGCRILKVLTGFNSCISAISMTPDSREAIIGCNNGSSILWDLETGQTLQNLVGHSDGITDVSVTANGNYAISSSLDQTCILWDLKTGQVLRTLRGHIGGVKAVCITADGKYVISGAIDNACILWDMDTGQIINKYFGHTKPINAISMTPDGRLAISGSTDQSCILWDLRTGHETKSSGIVRKRLSDVDVSMDGKYAILGYRDSTCILWDLEEGRIAKELKGHSNDIESVHIGPGCQCAISGSSDKSCIFWDLEKGKSVHTFIGHTWAVNSVRITPDGNRAISASSDGSCILWDAKKARSLKTLKGHSRAVNCVTLLPSGRSALSTSFDSTCILWDLENGQELKKKLVPPTIKTIFLTPDGKCALTGIFLWNLENGQFEKHLLGYTGQGQEFKAMNFTPDGKRAVSSLKDKGKSIVLWDIQNGQKLQKCSGHFDKINVVKLLPDGSHAVSGSDDRTCILWNLENGNMIARFVGEFPIADIALSCKGILLIGFDGETTIIDFGKHVLFTGPGIVTIRSIWDFDLHHYLALSADCPFCGTRFAPGENIVETIRAIFRSSGLGPNDSPCLYLPKECWEEPRLLSSCPKCHEALRFNPFLIDPEGRYY